MHTEDAFVSDYLRESARAAEAFAGDPEYRETLLQFGDHICAAFRAGHKLLIAGNGGSAADAQHMAGELVVRLFYDHAPLPAIALMTNGSVISAAGNDYGYEHVFERQVLALGQEGDIFLAISTSGNSPNILRALTAAQQKKMLCLGLTGQNKGKMAADCDAVFCAPSATTSVIQQIHITAIHILCGIVEHTLFPQETTC